MLNKDIITIGPGELEQLLKVGMPPDNGTEPFRNSPLCFACQYDRTDIAQMLIHAGADVNFPGFHGRTPLFYAADKGNIPLAEILLQKGADIHHINKDGKNILMDIAIHKPGAEMVKWLIDHGCNIDHHFTKYAGDTQRVFASRAEYNQHRSVLRTAVYCDAFDMVKVLIEHGADGATDGWQKDAFLLSLECQSDQIALWLLSHRSLRYEDRDWVFDAIHTAMVHQKDRVRALLNESGILTSLGDEITNGHTEGVKLKLSIGFPPDGSSRSGQDSPLCHACQENKTAIAGLLLAAGAQVNFRGQYGRTPLMYAVQHNNRNLAGLLLEKGADINACTDNGDNMLTDYNASELQPETIDWLISKGIDIHYRNGKTGMTALIQSITYHRNELAKKLIERGAEGAKEGWQEEAFLRSLDHFNREMASFLLDHYKGQEFPGGREAIRKALSLGNHPLAFRVLEFIPESDLITYVNDHQFDEAFENSAYHGDLEMCRFFSEAGWKAGAGRDYWIRPLLTASRYGKQELVNWLLENNADPDARDFEGNSCLALAASQGHLTTARLLLEAGADIHAKNKQGWTALMQAALFGRTDVLALLLDHGADPNDKAEEERNITALMLACDAGQPVSVSLLLEYGANPFAKDDIGYTAHKFAELSNKAGKEISVLLPPLPETPETVTAPQVDDPAECPICKGIGNYEQRRISWWGEDYRKHFFSALTLIRDEGETHAGFKYYTRTSYYECPRCHSIYKRLESLDMDNIPAQFELEVRRVNDTGNN